MTLRPALAAALLLALIGCATSAPAPDTGQISEGADSLSPALLAEADASFSARADPALRGRYTAVAELAAAEREVSVQVEALCQVARLFSLEQDLTAARVWLDLAATRATPEAPLGWTRYLGVRGILEREEADKAAAEATFSQMYDFAMANGLPRRAIDAAHHMAIVADVQGQIDWGRKGISAAEATGDDAWLGPLWNNLGWTYYDMGSYPEALDALVRAQGYHHKSKDPWAAIAADRSVGQVHRVMGQLDDAQPLTEGALAEARRLHAQAPDEQSAEGLGLCLWELGELRAAQARVGEAVEALTQGRALLLGAGIEQWWPEGLKQLDSTLSALGAPPPGP